MPPHLHDTGGPSGQRRDLAGQAEIPDMSSLKLPPDVVAGLDLARTSGTRMLSPAEVARLTAILTNLGTAAASLRPAGGTPAEQKE